MSPAISPVGTSRSPSIAPEGTPPPAQNPNPTAPSRWQQACAFGGQAGLLVYENIYTAGSYGLAIAGNLTQTAVQGFRAPANERALTWAGYYSVELSVAGAAIGLGGGVLASSLAPIYYLSLPAVAAGLGLGCSALVLGMVVHRAFYMQKERHAALLVTSSRSLEQASSSLDTTLERLYQLADAAFKNLDHAQRQRLKIGDKIATTSDLRRDEIHEEALQIRKSAQASIPNQSYTPLNVTALIPEHLVSATLQEVGYKADTPIQQKILIQLLFVKLMNRRMYLDNQRIIIDTINGLNHPLGQAPLGSDKSQQARGDFFKPAPILKVPIQLDSPNPPVTAPLRWFARLSKLRQIEVFSGGPTLLGEYSVPLACAGVAIGMGGAALVKYAGLHLGYIALPHVFLGLALVCVVNCVATELVRGLRQGSKRGPCASVVADTSAQALDGLTDKRKLECLYDLANHWSQEFFDAEDPHEKDFLRALALTQKARSMIPNAAVGHLKKDTPQEIIEKLKVMRNNHPDLDSHKFMRILRNITLQSTTEEYNALGYFLSEYLRPQGRSMTPGEAESLILSDDLKKYEKSDWCLKVIEILRCIEDAPNADPKKEQLKYRAILYYLLALQGAVLNGRSSLSDWNDHPEQPEEKYLTVKKIPDAEQRFASQTVLDFLNRCIASSYVASAEELVDMLKIIRLDFSDKNPKFKEVVQALKHFQVHRLDDDLMFVPYLVKMLETDPARVDYRMCLDMLQVMDGFEKARTSNKDQQILDTMRIYRKMLLSISDVLERPVNDDADAEKIAALRKTIVQKREELNRAYDDLRLAKEDLL